MDVAYVNPFIGSTINAFQTMMEIEVKPGKPVLKKDPQSSYDVSGIIGLSGTAQGSVAICFPKRMALQIVSKMLEQEIKVVGPELTDGVGELANIIAGGAKAGLANISNHALSISLPNVVIGNAHNIMRPTGLPGLVVPFSCSLGDFALEVALKTG